MCFPWVASLTIPLSLSLDMCVYQGMVSMPRRSEGHLVDQCIRGPNFKDLLDPQANFDDPD